MKHGDSTIRVGGVGTGRIFQGAHLQIYPQLLDKAHLVGFFDKQPARAKAAYERYTQTLKEYAGAHPESAEAVKANLAQLRCYESLDALLDEVDVVDVCTTTRGKMPTAIRALEKGVHSMIEKPMARTWIEADRASRAFAGTPEIYCQLNDDNVFEPKYLVLGALVRQGQIGNAQSMWLIRGSTLDATSVLKSQASAVENGGGCLMDYGSHGLAAAWHVVGTHLVPVKVDAVRIEVRFPHRVLEGDPFTVEVDDDAHVKILFEDPQSGAWTTIFLEATWSGGEIGPSKEKRGGQNNGYLRIEGDEGVIDGTEADRVTITRWDGGQTIVPIREFPSERISFIHEIEGFIDAVRMGKPPEIDVHYGAEVIAICGAAYLSAIRKRAVSLEEFKDFSREYVQKYGDNEQAEAAILTDLLKPYQWRK
ncbi:MAG: Gfo/Idh/MocA family oxidoreductase [Candidatus Poribacteria bacterium]|nr:Gfo/Idh/MocA family oxidoreductase [Candidatus Poribacteria bacterium]